MTLTQLFTSIANAIRSKKGTSATIVAEDFPTEISSIQTGITPTGTINITQNGMTDVTNYAIADVNISGGGGTELNIFTGITEPIIKKGIWLETNLVDENYVYDTKFSLEGEWSSSEDTTNIPYNFTNGCAVAINNNVYLLGSEANNNQQNNYKYNTIADTYTQLTNIPYDFKDSSAVVVGTNIYILGSSNSSSNAKYNYKYDTLTDTYTKMTNIPYNFYMGSAVVVGTDIYILGSYASASYYRYNYKYNTLTNTYTKMNNIPYDFYAGSAVAVGTDFYVLGSASSSYSKYNRIYHTKNSSYSTNNTVVLVKGNTYSAEIITTNLFEEGYQPIINFSDVYYYTTQNGLNGTIPTYYGDGTSWTKFKN